MLGRDRHQRGQRRARQVAREFGAGPRSVAIVASVDDRLVLRSTDRHRPRLARQVHAAIALGEIRQFRQQLGEPLPAAAREARMERAMVALPLVDLVERRVGRHRLQALVQERVILRSHRQDGQPDAKRLVGDPHGVQLLDVLDRQRRDRHAAVRLALDQPLTLEHSQRLAQRRAADAELARELDLGDDAARLEAQMQDRLAQLVVDEVGAGAVLASVVCLDLGDVGHDPILKAAAGALSVGKICIQIVVRVTRSV